MSTKPSAATRPAATNKKSVLVAVGVIENKQGEIFICRRGASQHQADKWEFPGGKVETGETITRALARELAEEVGIVVQACQPFMQIEHDYGDKHVTLAIRKVTAYSGEPGGLEGQPSRWVPISELSQYDFPAANSSIVDKLQTEAAN